jgi:restriction system protein
VPYACAVPADLQRRGQLVREVFAVLRHHAEGMRAAEVLAEVERRLPPTPYEASTYARNPNVRRYEKIIRFSSINAVRAGWLVKDRGVWSLTDEGAAAYEQFTDPETFYREAIRLYQSWARQRAGEPEPDEIDVDDRDPGAAVTLERAEESAWNEIEHYVARLSPYEFQDLVAALLRAMGYHVSWVAPRGADRGVDIVAHTDPLGASNPRILVQVKHRPESRVPADEIRSFAGVLGERDVGLFVSSGGFTRDAEGEARMQERRRLTAIDLRRFLELWVQHLGAMSDMDRQRLPLKAVYFIAPAT